MDIGSLHYDLDADTSKLNKSLNSADKSVQTFGDRMSKHWDSSVAASKKLMLGVVALGAATVAFGISSIKAYNESQMALTQLSSVLKSTGGAAGVTKASAIALSKEIQRTTSLSDEAALAVENMGLTFTAIGKNIFPTATKAAIDMATAMNHGLKPSAEQSADAMKLLGKALQDPDAGLGALHRVGVNTEELKKKFVGLTSITEKQKLILKEIGTEFGGSAAAQAKTFSGRIDQMKNAFNDLQEQVGAILVKALGPLADWFSKWIAKVNEAGGLMVYLQGIWERNKNAIIAVAGAIAGALVPALVAMAQAFGLMIKNLSPFMLVGAAIALIILHWNDITKVFAATVDWLRGKWEAIKPIGIFINDHIIQPMVGLVKDVGNAIKTVASEAITKIKDAFDALKKTASDVLNTIVGWIKDNQKAIENWAIVISVILLPKIIAIGVQFAITSAQAIAHAAITSAAWIASAATSLYAWVTVTLPGIITGFSEMALSALAKAVLVTGSLVGSAVATAGAWLTTFAEFGIGVAIMVVQATAAGIRMGIGFALALGPIGLIAIAAVAVAALIILNWTKVKNFFVAVWQSIWSGAKTAFDNVVSFFSGLIKGIQSFGGGIISAITKPFKTAFDWIQSQVDRLIGVLERLKNAAGSVVNAPGNALKGIGNLLGKIPGFATGGIVPGSIGKPMLAVVHGGEQVIPNGGQAGITFNVGTINDRSDADYILRRIDRNQQLEGRGVSPV